MEQGVESRIWTMEEVLDVLNDDETKLIWRSPEAGGMNMNVKMAKEDGIRFSMQFRTDEHFRLEGNGLKKAVIELARGGFQHMKDLSLGRCDMVKYLAAVDCVLNTNDVLFPKLGSLILYDLRYLREICYGQLPMQSFRQLRCVELCGNIRLKYLFSLSIASGLVELEQLSISECDMMIEVFKERRGDGKSTKIKIELPNLKDLKLEKLSSLNSFCKGIDEIYFPQLNNLYLQELPRLESFCCQERSLFWEKVILIGVKNLYVQYVQNFTEIWSRKLQASSFCELRVVDVFQCDNLLNVFPSNLIRRLQCLEELRVCKCVSLEVVVDFEDLNMEEGSEAVILPCLRKVVLCHLPKLTDIWKESPRGIQGFQNLSSLEIKKCDSLGTIFSLSIAKHLSKLQELKIGDCKILEKIVANDLGGGEYREATNIVLLRLRSLVLVDLPNLMSFFSRSRMTLHYNRLGAFPRLEVLELDGLPKLTTMGQHHLPVGSLSRLRKMTLRRLPKLTQIYKKGTFYENLIHLSVDRCSILRNVFSASMISGLVHLHELIIDDCSMMEEIIAVEEEQEKGSMDTIEFPHLNHLELRKLPRLTSFCHMKRDSEFPLLEKVVVHGCPRMNIFSRGLLRTPKLKGVDVGQWERVWMGDLNITIEHLFKAKGFPEDSLYTTIRKRSCRKWAKTIARGVAMIALRGFINVNWDNYEVLFPRDRKMFKSFKVSVFKAMIKFVLSVHDMEDFERAVDIDKIASECEKFWRSLCTVFDFPRKPGDDPLTAISERKMDLSGFSKMREHDIGHILKLHQSQYSHEVDRPENIGFTVKPWGLSFHHIKKAIECMKEYVPMKEKNKMHLLMELKDRKCFCTLDACYMESWREIMKIQDVEKCVHSELDKLEDLASRNRLLNKLEFLASFIHNVIYDMAATKMATLHKCQSLDVFPLASNVFGQWKEEAVEVVRCAEIERRSQGCRFIGVNHLLSCLRRTSIQESTKKFQLLEPPIVDPGEPTTHPVYHIYKSSHDIARTLDDPQIGLKHLYLAIVFRRNGTDKTDWEAVMRKPEVKDFLESVKNVEGKSSGDKGETSSEVINLWSRFLPDGGKRRHIDGSVLEVVKSIQKGFESGFSPLQEVEHKSVSLIR